VTVRLQERGLVIVSQSLANGFRLEVDRSEPYRLRIRLVSADHVTRIEVRVQDGELTGTVDDSNSGGGNGGGFSGDPGGPPETANS